LESERLDLMTLLAQPFLDVVHRQGTAGAGGASGRPRHAARWPQPAAMRRPISGSLLRRSAISRRSPVSKHWPTKSDAIPISRALPRINDCATPRPASPARGASLSGHRRTNRRAHFRGRPALRRGGSPSRRPA
jgi:hypothetical protein